jgi:uncharacterized protein (TIGR00255 family)
MNLSTYLNSMTGFGASTRSVANGEVSIELRSVNHKHFDVTFRGSLNRVRDQGVFEGYVRRLLKERGVVRGKIDVSVSLHPHSAERLVPKVDKEALVDVRNEYSAILEGFKDIAGRHLEEEKASNLLVSLLRERIPSRSSKEVLSTFDELSIQGVCQEAVSQLMEHRRREGEALSLDFLERLQALETLTHDVKVRSQSAAHELFASLFKRVQELTVAMTEVNRERLELEIALLAQKGDVSEEIVRIYAHLVAFRRLITEGPVGTVTSSSGVLLEVSKGKRLEFLIQELHREVTTISSKFPSVVSLTLEMKSQLEKMREQSHNIE